MKPKAVLFDCDGVLVDSEPTVHRLLAYRLSEAGLSVTPAQVSGMFLGGTIAGLAGHAKTLGAAIGEGWVEEIYAEMNTALADTVEIPGARALVMDLLAAKIPLAVCSNGPVAKMEVTLGATGMWHALEGHLFSAHVHATPKPAPDLYLMAAERLGVTPDQCLVVEDSANGARAARAAGMPCLALALPENADAVRAEGATVISTLDAVRRAVLG